MKRCTVIPAHQTARAMRLSHVSFYYYSQVCFAGLFRICSDVSVRCGHPDADF